MSSWLPMHASATDAVGDGLGVGVGLADGVGVGVGTKVPTGAVGDGLGVADAAAVTRCPEPASPRALPARGSLPRQR
jgi:hypothetical protein